MDSYESAFIEGKPYQKNKAGSTAFMGTGPW